VTASLQYYSVCAVRTLLGSMNLDSSIRLIFNRGMGLLVYSPCVPHRDCLDCLDCILPSLHLVFVVFGTAILHPSEFLEHVSFVLAKRANSHFSIIMHPVTWVELVVHESTLHVWSQMSVKDLLMTLMY